MNTAIAISRPRSVLSFAAANRMHALFALILLAFATAGCGKILDPGPPLNQVLLSARMPAKVQGPTLPLQLVVSQPTSANDLSGDRIAALMNGYEVRYLDSAKWANAVPDMVQRLLVDSLEATGGIAGVGTDDSGLDPQVRLSCDIKRFYLRYQEPGKAPVAEISLRLRLIDLRSGKALGNTAIDTAQQSAGESPQELVAAFSIAASKALAQNSDWVLATLAKAPQ